MTDEIPQWAWERLRELMGYKQDTEFRHWRGFDNLARYIVAHEQPPVDPLLVEAREIAATCDLSGMANWRKFCRAGHYDGGSEVSIALAALKRGIELGKGANND